MKKVLLTAALAFSTMLAAQSIEETMATMPAINTVGDIESILEEWEDTMDSAQFELVTYIMLNTTDSVVYFTQERLDEDGNIAEEITKSFPLSNDSLQFFLFITRAQGYWDEYLITRQKL
jgi:GH15 family glucan-1,4-alpha-glucosidase